VSDLLFNGSIWCNIDLALSHIEAIYKQDVEPLGLNVVEWYIMRSLYEKDGQMPTRLAEGVGRAATSFTPILDKVQNKGLIERRQHTGDRRAVRIYLTEQGRALEEPIKASVERVEHKLQRYIKKSGWQAFQKVVLVLQDIEPQAE